jgi:hypothetical protein
MSDTPETDAVAAHEGNWDTKFFRMKHHADRLERERNAAREAFVIATDQMVIAKGEARRANKERNEAWKLRDEAVERFLLAEDERIDMAKQLESEKERHAFCRNRLDEICTEIEATYKMMREP